MGAIPIAPTAHLPFVTVWTTAKESNLIQLLPQERARNYALVYREADLATDVLIEINDKWSELDKFELRFDDAVVSGKPDVAKMTSAQLDDYVGVLGDVYLVCQGREAAHKPTDAWNGSILSPGDQPFYPRTII